MKRLTYDYPVSAVEAAKARENKKAAKAKLLELIEERPSLTSRSEKVQNTKAQKELEAEFERYETLLKNAPPPELSEEEIKQVLHEQYNRFIANNEKKLEELDKRFAKNRLHVIEWNTTDIIECEFKIRTYKFILKILDETTFIEFFDYIESFYNNSVEDILQGACYGAAHSTNQIANVIKNTKREVKANFWTGHFSSGSASLNQIYKFEMNFKAWEEINK